MHRHVLLPWAGWMATSLLTAAAADAAAPSILTPYEWTTFSDAVTVHSSTGAAPRLFQQRMVEGDFNGDGCTDLALGIVGSASVEARVRILYGVTRDWQLEGGCEAPLETQDIVSPETSGAGGSSGDYFGLSLASADLNHDGFDDLVVSAPYADQPRPPGMGDVGAIYLYPGSRSGLGTDAELPAGDATYVLYGASASERIGQSIATAGELASVAGDDQAIGDLWVMAEGSASHRVFLHPIPETAFEPRARVRVDTQEPSSRWMEVQSDAAFQFYSTVQTWNRDGSPWLLIAQTQNSTGQRGQLFLFPAAAGSVPLSAAEVWEGESNTGEQLGYSLLPIPSDLSRSDDIWRQNSSTVGASSQPSSATSDAGDVLWIGAPYWSQPAESMTSGRLYRAQGSLLEPLFTDPAHTTSAIRPADGSKMTGGGIGTSLALLPDMDGDGLDELAVGSQGLCISGEEGAPTPGRISLVLSQDLAAETYTLPVADPPSLEIGVLPTLDVWEGAAMGDCFGASLAGGDFNGDGKADLAVLALEADGGTGQLVMLWSISDLLDHDGDGVITYAGLGDASSYTHFSGWTVDANDCDDANPAQAPTLEEICDGIDNDCDEATDEDLLVTYYPDADGDGYGDPTSDATLLLQACEAPPGYVADDADCDDTRDEVHPDAAEICDGRDNDCVEGLPVAELDQDGDGFIACVREGSSCPDGADCREDCDDNDDAVSPGALERCNFLDDDCDGALAANEQYRADWIPGCDRPDRNCDGDGFSSGLDDDQPPRAAPGCLSLRTGLEDDAGEKQNFSENSAGTEKLHRGSATVFSTNALSRSVPALKSRLPLWLVCWLMPLGSLWMRRRRLSR